MKNALKKLKNRADYVLLNENADVFLDAIIVIAAVLIITIAIVSLLHSVMELGKTRNNATQGTGWFRNDDLSEIHN